MLKRLNLFGILPLVVLIGVMAAGARTAPSGQNGGAASERRVALTFDDLPMAATQTGGGCDPAEIAEVNRAILVALEEHGAPATGFAIADNVCGPAPERLLRETVEEWLAAGHPVENHSGSHPDYNNVTAASYRIDVARGAGALQEILSDHGRRVRYFRPPLLHTGETPAKAEALRRYLAEAGQQMAPVTLDNQEWVFNAVYAGARARGDTALAARVASAYLEHLDEVFAYYERLSVELLDREPPQVLLLHANRINADHLGELLRRIAARGYEFVPLEEALADPAYDRGDPYVGPRGLSWLIRWALEAGMEVPPEPREPAWLQALNAAGSSGEIEGRFESHAVGLADRQMPYSVYLPAGFDPGREWPVVLALHGAGSRGTDGMAPRTQSVVEAARLYPARYPAIVVIPQLPPGERWTGPWLEMADRALSVTLRRFPADSSRVYLVGQSLGADGVFELASARPDRFAAALAVAMGAGDPAFDPRRLSGLPFWIFHGERDPIPVERARQRWERLSAAGAAEARHRTYPELDHEIFDTVYRDPAVSAWLFRHRRGVSPRAGPPEPDRVGTSERHILHDVTVIDGVGTPARRASVLVEDGRIRQIGSRDAIGLHSGATVHELSGRFLLPGLIDVHAHARTAWSLEELLAHGVTTIRNPSSSRSGTTNFAAEVNEGRLPGPHVITAGPVIDAPPRRSGSGRLVTSPDELREVVREQAASGVDWIKLYVDLPPGMVAAGVEEGHRLGLRVAGDLVSTSWRDAAGMGIDALSHLALRDADLLPPDRRAEYRRLVGDPASNRYWQITQWLEWVDPESEEIRELAALLAARGVFLDPTLVVEEAILMHADAQYRNSLDLSGVSDATVAEWDRQWQIPLPRDYASRVQGIRSNLLRLVRAFFDAGVPIAAGTDTPMPWVAPGASLHRELELLVEAGISPVEAIEIATHNGARMLGIEGETGSVAVGKRADLLVLSADPLADIRNTRRIEMVFKAGRLAFDR